MQRFLSQPFFVAEIFTGTPGAFVDLETTCLGRWKEQIAGWKEGADGDILGGSRRKALFLERTFSSFFWVV